MDSPDQLPLTPVLERTWRCSRQSRSSLGSISCPCTPTASSDSTSFAVRGSGVMQDFLPRKTQDGPNPDQRRGRPARHHQAQAAGGGGFSSIQPPRQGSGGIKYYI